MKKTAKIALQTTTAALIAAANVVSAQTSDGATQTTLLPGYTVTCTDLNPGHFKGSECNGVDRRQQAGWVDVGGPNDLYDNYHAALWSGTEGSLVDLHPTGPSSSELYSVAGGQQVGWVTFGQWTYGAFDEVTNHAALWYGSAGSFVDLHPPIPDANWSEALCTDGSRQVGMWSSTPGYLDLRAALWSGTAESFVNLNPTGSDSHSCAYAISGNQQAGWASFGDAAHAVIWFGTADSIIDLNPSDAISSRVYSTTGAQQAGYAQLGNDHFWKQHAALWYGTADSFVDLQPSNAVSSCALANAADVQVGYVDVPAERYPWPGQARHAALWSGTADSFVDLHSFLDSWGYTDSEACAVWTDGTTIKIAGFVEDPGMERAYHAVLWTLTPRDTTPPVIRRAWCQPAILRYPGNPMVRVRVEARVVDDSGTASWKVTHVSSNEPAFDARDIRILSDHEVMLRASSPGGRPGRIYTILIQAEDSAGNVSLPKPAYVFVPRTPRHRWTAPGLSAASRPGQIGRYGGVVAR